MLINVKIATLYNLSKSIVWWYSCNVNINNLPYSDSLRQSLKWTWFLIDVYFKIGFLNFSNICCWYTLELPHWGNSKNVHLQHYVNSINECFSLKIFFSQTSTICNEHLEMNMFLCSLACTWIPIIDSQLYIIDSLSLNVSLEQNAKLVVVWLLVLNYWNDIILAWKVTCCYYLKWKLSFSGWG